MIATARHGIVIYAAVRPADGGEVFGPVLPAERRDGVLCDRPVGEDMGPTEDRCPARILDLLGEPVNDDARGRRARCRSRLARDRPRPGRRVRFERSVTFTDGSEHRVLGYVGGPHSRDDGGRLYRVPNRQDLGYVLLEAGRAREPRQSRGDRPQDRTLRVRGGRRRPRDGREPYQEVHHGTQMPRLP